MTRQKVQGSITSPRTQGRAFTKTRRSRNDIIRKLAKSKTKTAPKLKGKWVFILLVLFIFRILIRAGTFGYGKKQITLKETKLVGENSKLGYYALQGVNELLTERCKTMSKMTKTKLQEGWCRHGEGQEKMITSLVTFMVHDCISEIRLPKLAITNNTKLNLNGKSCAKILSFYNIFRFKFYSGGIKHSKDGPEAKESAKKHRRMRGRIRATVVFCRTRSLF